MTLTELRWVYMSVPSVPFNTWSLGYTETPSHCYPDFTSKRETPLPAFISAIAGLRDLPLGVLKTVTAYSDKEYLHSQIYLIETLFQASFCEKFIQKTFYACSLPCSAIPGFCLEPPSINGFGLTLLTTDSILAINKTFPNISEFAGDGSSLFDDNLRVFHTFKQLTHLALNNCQNITAKGIKNLLNIEKLKHVILNGSKYLVQREEYPKGTSRQVLFFTEEASKGADRLLDKHPCLHTFEADGLNKVLPKPTDEEFEQLLSKMSNLSLLPSFLQESCRNLSDLSLKLLTEKCQGLQQLVLFDCYHFTEQGIREIAKLPRLKMISLYGCKKVKEDSTLKFFPHLKPKVACLITKQKEP